MVTIYKLIEPDHWMVIGIYDTLDEAQRECDRLNREKRGHCVEKIVNGIIHYRDSTRNYEWRSVLDYR